MLIFLSSDYQTLGLSPEEMQSRMGKWFAWNQKRAGSEIKELIGGYYIVNAADLDDAMKIAENYPDYDLGGTVEIREVMVFDNN